MIYIALSLYVLGMPLALIAITEVIGFSKLGNLFAALVWPVVTVLIFVFLIRGLCKKLYTNAFKWWRT
jgi:hypothetical protein